MKKILMILVLFSINIICINKINAAIVSSNGDFTIRGEKYNINTTKATNQSDIKIKEVQMYQNKTVSEICKYTEENEDDKNDIKYLFIYSDGSSSVGWVSQNNFIGITAELDKYGDDENDQNGKESIVLNWTGGVTASNWDSKNKRLTTNDDAYIAHEKGACPYYLVLNNNGWENYIYISTEDGYDNLEYFKDVAKTPQGNKEIGTVHVFYSVNDLDKSRAGLSCSYKYEDEDIFTLNFDNNGEPSIDLPARRQIGDYLVDGFKLMTNFESNKYWSYIEDGKCPYKIQTCLQLNTEYSSYVINVYGDESSVSGVECNPQMEFYCDGDKCSSGECGKYSDFYDNLKKEIENYKGCNNNSTCKKEALDDYNFQKNTITAFCESVLKNLNYSKGGCVESCLNLSKDIDVLEVGVLKTKYSEDVKCNIGASILSMVYNVLKWAKYIAPILVIILSILDFIKAIAAQNDDDMKKAQGKFVKRLIVAALLFLLPLIINFMLKTFGLYNSDCDISNLFS